MLTHDSRRRDGGVTCASASVARIKLTPDAEVVPVNITVLLSCACAWNKQILNRARRLLGSGCRLESPVLFVHNLDHGSLCPCLAPRVVVIICHTEPHGTGLSARALLALFSLTHTPKHNSTTRPEAERARSCTSRITRSHGPTFSHLFRRPVLLRSATRWCDKCSSCRKLSSLYNTAGRYRCKEATPRWQDGDSLISLSLPSVTWPNTDEKRFCSLSLMSYLLRLCSLSE